MVNVFYLVVLLVGNASAMFNMTKLVSMLDNDGDGNITRSSVDSLFTSSFGSNVTDRCKFMDLFVNQFQASAINASILFDTIQSADRQATATALTSAFMGGPDTTVITVSNFMAILSSLYTTMEKIISKPTDFPVGYTFWPHSQFEVTRWGSESDVDHNGELTRAEISAAMRKLDQNGDWSIRQCEYINSMTLYMQHSVTAAKLYDVIFHNRDTNWADVDSDFLMMMMGSTGGAVTMQQFVDFFAMQNLLSAGLTVSQEDGSVADGCESVLPYPGLTSLCVTSTVLMLLSNSILC